jgi:hypothetical protein
MNKLPTQKTIFFAMLLPSIHDFVFPLHPDGNVNYFTLIARDCDTCETAPLGRVKAILSQVRFPVSCSQLFLKNKEKES